VAAAHHDAGPGLPQPGARTGLHNGAIGVAASDGGVRYVAVPAGLSRSCAPSRCKRR
jgi:hypothetical protein